MTWQYTFPDPTMYYHAPRKIIRPPATDAPLDRGGSMLKLWTPHKRHKYGDPYRKEQRGHLARITLTQWTPEGSQVQYDVHQTKNGITANVETGSDKRNMTINELEWLAGTIRNHLRDYDHPATILGSALEAVLHYRSRAQRRMITDLDTMVNAYYAQEAGRTITIQ